MLVPPVSESSGCLYAQPQWFFLAGKANAQVVTVSQSFTGTMASG
jgi:hypothetical protein